MLAAVSHIHRRKLAVNSLQMVQSPASRFNPGHVTNPSNYCFSSLDKSDRRARISARQNNDSLLSRAVDDSLPLVFKLHAHSVGEGIMLLLYWRKLENYLYNEQGPEKRRPEIRLPFAGYPAGYCGWFSNWAKDGIQLCDI